MAAQKTKKDKTIKLKLDSDGVFSGALKFKFNDKFVMWIATSTQSIMDKDKNKYGVGIETTF